MATLSFVVRRLPHPSTWLSLVPVPELFRVERVVSHGAPEAVAPLLDAALAERAGRPWSPLEGAAVEEALLARFPFLEAASADRDWSARAVTVTVLLRTPIARARRNGRDAGWLAEDGLVFEAPAGAYPPLDVPEADLGTLTDPRLPALAELVRRAATELPSKTSRFAYRSAEDGWLVAAADGTTLAWGGLDWTAEKLSRLQQVLGDAAPRFGGGLTADLRYFEDGKILVRPAPSAARPATPVAPASAGTAGLRPARPANSVAPASAGTAGLRPPRTR
ncbi:MAG: hypothetical protein HY553_09265 [Elusimicrobia bacterium]|nr:hypothetical protein [Elusimicrobiota bacterium]